MISGIEVAPEVFALFGGVLLFIVTVGTGMAAWALRELVRLTNAVTKLEEVVASLGEERRDHDRRISALELHHWNKDRL